MFAFSLKIQFFKCDLLIITMLVNSKKYWNLTLNLWLKKYVTFVLCLYDCLVFVTICFLQMYQCNYFSLFWGRGRWRGFLTMLLLKVHNSRFPAEFCCASVCYRLCNNADIICVIVASSLWCLCCFTIQLSVVITLFPYFLLVFKAGIGRRGCFVGKTV